MAQKLKNWADNYQESPGEMVWQKVENRLNKRQTVAVYELFH